MSAVLLDTHVLVWWKGDQAQLSPAAATAIDDADRIYISPITFWEITLLVGRERIALDRDVRGWTHDILAGERVDLAPFDARIAVAAGELGSGDPADRFLASTAIELDVPLITKDTALRGAMSDQLRTIW